MERGAGTGLGAESAETETVSSLPGFPVPLQLETGVTAVEPGLLLPEPAEWDLPGLPTTGLEERWQIA